MERLDNAEEEIPMVCHYNESLDCINQSIMDSQWHAPEYKESWCSNCLKSQIIRQLYLLAIRAS